MTDPSYKVVIFQHRLLHYRERFFEDLRLQCEKVGISLHVVHGQASPREKVKNDEGYLAWSDRVNNRFLSAGRRELLWTPFPERHKDADLVILMQENRILSNYPILISGFWKKRKVAFWGHGINFQSPSPSGLAEKWKRIWLGGVDWWFAYTSGTARLVRQAGYPPERISCLNNAIDNSGFEKDLRSVGVQGEEVVRKELGFSENDLVCLFCGSLYEDKRLQFLIDVSDRIRESCNSFRLVIIGDGPSSVVVKEAASSRPWVRWVGAKKGREKAVYFKISELVLNPGLVGLHVLDSFCSGVPMVTTADAKHSPEFEYLRSGENGLVCYGDVEVFSEKVLELLNDKEKLKNMKLLAMESARFYTLDNMVENFFDGVKKSLEYPKKVKIVEKRSSDF